MPVPTYEIYALKYAGPFTRPASMMVWFQDMDKTVLVDYFIFAIRGGGETIFGPLQRCPSDDHNACHLQDHVSPNALRAPSHEEARQQISRRDRWAGAACAVRGRRAACSWECFQGLEWAVRRKKAAAERRCNA